MWCTRRIALIGLGLALVLLAPIVWEGVASEADADVPKAFRLKSGKDVPGRLTGAPDLPLFPELQDAAQSAIPDRPRAEKLTPRSRLELLRYVSGEFARAVKPLPADKKGFRYPADKPLDDQALRRILMSGSAANPGDTVQITALEFKDKEIVVQINGGAKGKKRWRDRIQVSVGGGIPTAQTTGTQVGPPGFQALGSTLILDYGRPLPDLTPDELKQHLGVFLDFSKQRSASVSWIESLPPEFQQAIKERRAMVGMDKEMVIAAMGKPERKVRERDPDGLETEDWIYGHPPAKTVFVKFAGEKVISVKQFPR